MTLIAFLIPGADRGQDLRPLLVQYLDAIEGDVEIAYRAKLAVQPFQFVPDLVADGVFDHRREEQDGGAQMRERNPHLMQRGLISGCGRFPVGNEGINMPPRHDPECGIAGHGAVEPGFWQRALLPHRLGAECGLAGWLGEGRHGSLRSGLKGPIIIGPAGAGNLRPGSAGVGSAAFGCIAKAFVAEHLPRAAGKPASGHRPIGGRMRLVGWLAAALIAGNSCALAQGNYPDRPIKMIVPLAAASAVDVAPRIVTQKMAGIMGEQTVILNQPGASGLTGAEQVAHAEPDGYTIGGFNDSIMTMVPNLQAKMRWDILKDFEPVSLVATVEWGLVTANQTPY